MSAKNKLFTVLAGGLIVIFLMSAFPGCSTSQRLDLLKSKAGDLIVAYKNLPDEAKILFRRELDKVTAETGCQLRLACEVESPDQ